MDSKGVGYASWSCVGIVLGMDCCNGSVLVLVPKASIRYNRHPDPSPDSVVSLDDVGVSSFATWYTTTGAGLPE